jgi:predicted P-loop ATPase
MSDRFRVSFFRGLKFTWPRVEELSFDELARRFDSARADTKDDLPMLKLAVFEGGAKREHVKCLTGAMVDYDGEIVSMDEAADRISAAGIAAFLYTSPSSLPEKPRWRALAPYSREMDAIEHQTMTDRLNGALGGVIDDASCWEAQQRFFYGQAKFRDAKKGGGAAEKVNVIITEGDPIDVLDIAPAPRPSRVRAARGADFADLLDDEDDLFDLVRTSPLGLSEEEIDEYLANVPNDGSGCHYDDYVEVGMALHHEYSGSAEGFEKFSKWAEQSDKFSLKNVEGRWRSFNQGTKTPVRMASIIQKANAYRKADNFAIVRSDHSFEDLLADIPSLSDGDILLPGAVTQPWVRATALNKLINPDWTKALQEVEHEKNGRKWKTYKKTLNNIVLLLENDPRLFGCLGFNEFRQEPVLIEAPKSVALKRDKDSDKPKVTLDGPLWEKVDPINGKTWTDAHDHSLRALFEAPRDQGGHDLPVADRDLRAAVSIVAQRNRFHPVRDRLDDLAGQWEAGAMPPAMDRLFIDYLGSPDTAYHRRTARALMLGAVARVFEPGHKFDYAVILEGAQGLRKSTFIETLSMGWFAELEGDLHDRKAMVEKMQGAWILEIPELQGFNKADVTVLKGIMSARSDKVRLAYAHRADVFERQCVFIGSTNDDEYLRDPTGGRRFWPVRCTVDEIDIERLKENLFWLWAEAAWTYKEMRSANRNQFLPLYLDDKDAAQQAVEMQNSRTIETAESTLAGEILAWLDTPFGDFDIDPDGIMEYRNETCIAQIWREMLARTGSIPHQETIKIGAALNRINWRRSPGVVKTADINKKYGPCRVYTRR